MKNLLEGLSEPPLAYGPAKCSFLFYMIAMDMQFLKLQNP